MTSTNPLDWEYHQVDHLFLLIGENPLPNYVAAKTLLREGGKPYLVYSEHTFEAYKRLKEVLDITEEEKVELWNNEANAFKIQKAIKDKVKQLKKDYPKKTRFGLNYTGGTKAMAVHAYQALLDPELKLSEEPRFSYLDPRSLQMMFDRNNGQSIGRPVPTEKLDIKGETLFSLHGLRWKGDKPISESKCLDAANNLIDLYLKIIENNEKQYHSSLSKVDETTREWQDWCKKVMTPKTWEYKSDKKYSDWKDEEVLEKVELDLTTAPTAIKDILIPCFGVTKDIFSLKTAKEKGGFEKIHHVCEWLNCGWLEHYVLSEVGKISVKPPIHAEAASFNIVDIKQKSDEVWDKFQFDVAFMRGYQFFAISCTTSSIVDVCKEKLFEAYVRARQLGGSEARVILVCFNKKPEIIADTFLSLIKDQKIAVFGRKDIKNLSKAIEKWIEKLDEDVKKYRGSV
ncbi:conserved hypothetical protein [Planktothrix sp. PCC 11201]|uniref:Card1-like endonuclease domain-containing protein n=1 Tax=Planktothrix sp. PCC 11201 TaxID=1729650 RepID=UPI000920D6E4|nr:DUF1887 family CARF protein [Planktothrix sp. PCC 11201]SKB11344.1 conserved hypothetical protein [Planktothrix sp. PCC 11201]